MRINAPEADQSPRPEYRRSPKAGHQEWWVRAPLERKEETVIVISCVWQKNKEMWKIMLTVSFSKMSLPPLWLDDSNVSIDSSRYHESCQSLLEDPSVANIHKEMPDLHGFRRMSYSRMQRIALLIQSIVRFATQECSTISRIIIVAWIHSWRLWWYIPIQV